VPRYRKWMATAAICAVAIASGCRSSKQAETDTVSVRIAFTNSPISYAPVLLADSLEFYKKAGLSVTIDHFPNGTKTMEALLGRSADVGTGSQDQNVQLAAEGRDVKSFVLVTRYASRAVVLPPKSKGRIRRVEDLKGATVGVGGFGSITHLFLQYLFVKHGMPPDAVKIVSIGTGASAIAAIEHQLVDAAIVSGSDRIIIGRRLPGAVTLLDVTGSEGCREVFGVDVYPAGVVFATGAWLREHPETARRTAQAVQEALTWMVHHTPEQILDALPKRYRTDRDLDLQILRSLIPSYSRDGLMPRDGAAAVVKAMSITSEKIRSAKVEVASTYTNAFLSKP